MSPLDFTVLFGTLLFIVVYGVWKTRGSKNLQSYLKGDNTMKWGTIGLSIMATQASAITFLSTPGQAYESGMGFVQNYLGLPIALIIISAVFIPIYYRLKVYTAYEFLENRFDLKTRQMGAFLFLVQRGLAAGITIYAPAIIVTSILHWNLNLTIIFVGALVLIYTLSGGTKAVSLTQKYQMAVIMIGMFTAFFMLLSYLPDSVGFRDALALAGKMGKLEVIDFSFDYHKRYTFWSGLFGGLFLALSYFGTDQSQVQRYLSGKSIAESRMGLMFNALLKVPMQFFILLVGVMVFVFYQFEKPPVFFKQTALKTLRQSKYKSELETLEVQFREAFMEKKEGIRELLATLESGNEKDIGKAREKVLSLEENAGNIRSQVKDLLLQANPDMETEDVDFVFISFIMTYLPHGVIGLLLAVIFSAAMSSTSSELNALASTTTVDFYKRLIVKNGSDRNYLIASKLFTGLWGAVAIAFAIFANLVENLIEAVNILGSVFYGTILGVFLVAFFFKFIKGNAVFAAALIAQTAVIVLFFTSRIGYLWFNLIGCAIVLLAGAVIQALLPPRLSGR